MNIASEKGCSWKTGLVDKFNYQLGYCYCYQLSHCIAAPLQPLPSAGRTYLVCPRGLVGPNEFEQKKMGL